MSRRLLWMGLVGLAICAALGWMMAGTAVQSVDEREDNWTALIENRAGEPDYLALAAKVKLSGLLPESQNAEARSSKAGGQALSPNKAPPFPDIYGVYIIDGAPKVLLQSPGGKVQSVGAGEESESGWTVRAVDLTHIIAVYNGEERDIPIFKVWEPDEDAALDDNR